MGHSEEQTQPFPSAINPLLTFLLTRTAVGWSIAYLPSSLGFFREAEENQEPVPYGHPKAKEYMISSSFFDFCA